MAASWRGILTRTRPSIEPTIVARRRLVGPIPNFASRRRCWGTTFGNQHAAGRNESGRATQVVAGAVQFGVARMVSALPPGGADLAVARIGARPIADDVRPRPGDDAHYR